MAYALVVSLKQTLELLLAPGRSRIQIPNSELKLIYGDLCYLKSFFDKMNSVEDSNSVEELEKQMKDVLQNAEDLIDSHISDLFHSGDVSSISIFSGKLVEVKETLGSLIETFNAMEGYLTGDQQSPVCFLRNNKIVGLADVDGSSRTDFCRNHEIVGLEDEEMMLKQLLFQEDSSCKVISIVGMPGLGKITFAKTIYSDALISEHFDISLFMEIGVEYQLKNIVLGLLGQVGFHIEEMREVEVDELVVYLHKYLSGRRYLVVLDDIWDTRAWDELQWLFPDERIGSRIILTTTITGVARGACLEENILQKRFLNNEETWELLCKKAFSDMEVCPSELVEIGKAIVENLGGLPLAVVMIGKLLSVSERTVENWMVVAQNISSPIPETAIPMFMNLSYTQLPQHLKACFLYLGLFPPNYNIRSAQLIKLWVAEGFIEPVADKSLEQKAEEYLEGLVSRSLVIVHELSSTGGIKSCRIIHQLLHDLCVGLARQEKFFCIVNEGTTKGTKEQRRLGIHSNVIPGMMEAVSGVRSLVFICPQHQHPLQRFRWLRVLHALSISYCKFPAEVLRLVRLRYLAITFNRELPSSISRLWSLEVLIIHPTQSVKSSVFLPLEIWKLQKLRHLECLGFDLPDPSVTAEGHGNDLYLKMLLTLSGVSSHSCTEGVLARIPNLIKLGIRLDPITEHAVEASCFDVVFTNLNQLESFKCIATNVGLVSGAAFSLKGFPCGLRKLTLSECGFSWEVMTIISQLPILQVLKLRRSAFSGSEWMLYGGDFPCLKVLVLEDLDIEHLIAESYYFPALEQLLIRRCYKLQQIPIGFGDTPTLRVIEVDECSMSLIHSAKLIQELQEKLGNEDLQVRIRSPV